ncbi:Transthyretin-like family protein [Ostertagia ostertagi]
MHILTVVIALAVFPSCGGLFGIFGKKQRVVVKGEVECHGKPAENVRLVLYVKHWLYQSNMDKHTTDKTGLFVLNGTQRSIWKLDPRVLIYHECYRNNATKCSLRRTSLIVPRENITLQGKMEEVFFDYGKIPLESPLLNTLCDH